MFEPINQHKTADAAVEQIEDLILKGVLESGDRLPAERVLAEQMQVSRPVLRDALKILEERRLIEARQGGGTFVCDLIGPIFSDAIVTLIARHPAALDDYFEFRRGIEGQAAEQAAKRAAPSDIERLQELISLMQAAFETEEGDEEPALDVSFHLAIGEAAHNVVLMHTLRSCYRLLEGGVFYNRKRLYHHPAARTEILNQHVALFEAVRSKDPEGARRAAEHHIDYVRNAVAEAEGMHEREQLAGLRRQKTAKTTDKI